MSPQRIGSHYLLHEQIGQGGMGTVWRAEDTDAKTWCAIKVLRPEYAQDPAAVTRFVRERNALLALQHPNVVTLHDMLVEGERLALVMDLLTEGDLGRFRRDHGGTLPPGLAAELVAQVCDGLAAAHAKGIVHRDLKPGNVLMDRGRARLTDFGIARIGGETSATTSGTVMGTVSYMAPEALAGAKPAPACDVYAAGVTLYELLTGRPPFTGQPAMVIHDHLHAAPPRPDGLPGPLWQLIAVCLAKDPAARPTAAQLAAALRAPQLVAALQAVQSPGEETLAPATGAWRREKTVDVVPPAVVPAAPGLAAPGLAAAGLAAAVPAAQGPAAPGLAAPGLAAPGPARGAAEAANTPGKRRRTWAIVAAALVVVGAGVGALAAYGPGSAAAPRADSVTAPTVTGQASPVTAVRSLSPATSKTASQPGGHPASAVSSSSAAVPSTSGAVPSTSAADPVTTSAATSAAATPAKSTAATPSPTPTVSGLVMENLLSNWCLHVAGASMLSGALVEQGGCVVTDKADQWKVVATISANGDLFDQYQSVRSGLCLGVQGASEAADADLIQETCSTSSDHAQFWRTSYTSGTDYELINGHSGLCMGIGGGSTAENTVVIQGTCIGAAIQTWFTAASPG